MEYNEIEKPTDAQIDRIFQYRNQTQNAMLQHFYIFLLSHSMMFVAFTAILENRNKPVLCALSICGAFMSLIWLYVSYRQYTVFKETRDYLDEVCIEIKQFRDKRSRVNICGHEIKSHPIVLYGIPIIVFAAWIVFFVVGICI